MPGDFRHPSSKMRAFISLMILTSCHAFTPKKRVAIVTGGTRGIGKGIAEALADADFDLLLTYNTDQIAAKKVAAELQETYPGCKVECVGGDISLDETRNKIFRCFDKCFPPTEHELGVVVHNAGQYVGITSENSDGLTGKPLGFGDGSMLKEAADGELTGGIDLSTMKYYQRMYGDAFIDLCERGLARMVSGNGGSLIGISSPGCTPQYRASFGYDLPGSGKTVMEYAMRIYAVKAATKGVNCNVVIPGVTTSDAWSKLAEMRGMERDNMLAGIVERAVPLQTSMTCRELGDIVAFLCSPKGRFITGVSLPADGGIHLK